MSEPRSFSQRQRRALYLAAGGYCENCGVELDEGWHADHVIPHSMGGGTTIENGQALCPNCNLKKTDDIASMRFKSDTFGPPPYSTPHDWQERGIREFDRTEGNFLADVATGAGKTAFAAYLFRHHYGELWERIIIITHGATRRGQYSNEQEKAGGWLGDLGKFGIQAMPDWELQSTTQAPTLKGYHGCAITYAKLPGNETILKALSREKLTLVVFDEIHHLGDELAWGEAAERAFSHRKCHTVGLTATPFRSDNAQIPFVDYEQQEDGSFKSVGHVGYTYGDALRDDVLRYVNFENYGGEMEWDDSSGERHTATFEDDIPEHLMGGRLITAVTNKEWLIPAIKEADDKLTQIRDRVPCAGGLIVARNQSHAQTIASWMKEEPQFQETPEIIVSDDNLATSDIESFKQSDRRWVIAVKMISEGVDIKRLRVGVYASNVTAPLTIHQVTGRVLRGSDGLAWFTFPKDPRIVEVLEEIEEMRDHVIEQENGGDGGDGPVPHENLFEPVRAEQGEVSVMGPLFDEMEMMTEEQLKNLPKEALVAFVSQRGPEGIQKHSNPSGDGSPTKYADEQKLRNEISNDPGYVNQAAKSRYRDRYLRGGEPRSRAISDTHVEANKRCGIQSTSEATVEQLRKKRDLLKSWR